MKPSLIAVALLIFLLCPPFSVSLAQDSEAACSSRETVYPRSTTAIRENPSHASAVHRVTEPGEPLKVISSQRQGAWCWLQVRGGWLLDSALVLSSIPPSDCFRHETALTRGAIAIREAASHTAKAISFTLPGKVLEVIDSVRDGSYCWIQVRGGWLKQSGLTIGGAPPTYPIVTAEGCSSRDLIYTRVTTAINEEASHASRILRYTRPGTRFQALESKQVGEWCWLRVDEGWIVESVLAIPSGCYPHEMVYVTATMNVRAAPTTDSQIIGHAQAGDMYTANKSTRGEDWCWIKISDGWLAKTARALPNRPLYAAASRSSSAQQAQISQQRSDIDNCCFVDRECKSEKQWIDGYYAYQNNQCGAPGQAGANKPGRPIIEGSAEFIRRVDLTLDYLSQHAPARYAYVVGGADRIIEFSDGVEGNCRADAGGGLIRMETCIVHFGITFENQIFTIAAVLSHEACHTYQQRSGKYFAPEEVEPPCQLAARETFKALDKERKFPSSYE